jgi:arylsulfatase A-like enzyme
MDWMTGRIVDALKQKGLYENTLIIFSSDNGPVMDDGYADQAQELKGNHDPAGGFRGGKYSAYEAGTRVPMIVTYPNGLKKAGESDALISHIDLYRSLASLAGFELAKGEAIDSIDVLPALLDSSKNARKEMLEESFTLTLRSGKWKYVAPFNGTTPDWLANKTAIENGLQEHAQLFDISNDVNEKNNIAAQYPEVVNKLQQRLEAIKLGN